MTTTTGRPRMGRIWASGLVATTVATVINAVVYLLARAVGVGFEVVAQPQTDPMTLGVGPVVVLSVVAGLVATVVAAVLARFTRRPATIFVVLATVGLLLSFAAFPLQDLGAQDLSVVSLVVLGLMHVVVYALVVPQLTRRLRAR